jgi:hypothetical protein
MYVCTVMTDGLYRETPSMPPAHKFSACKASAYRQSQDHAGKGLDRGEGWFQKMGVAASWNGQKRHLNRPC